MTYNPDPTFGKAHSTFFGKVTAANTNLDGSGTITTLHTAGAEGGFITHLDARCQATVTATALRLFRSLDGGTTWAMIDEKLMAAYTVANTTAQTPVSFVNRSSPDSAIRLAPNEKIGCTIAVALAGGIVFSGEAVSLSQ